ncbi:UvrD-helicase domain-containing protein [Aliarcobacter cryaerophilus]|uniref:DNA 3'-5' helicase n=3 Tax=unclassified Arcobacter TaxID=2593671 RepID=A0AA96D0S3_9BACT|nr:ATP-dependent helicase [Arcobacter sp. AZ-2023]WNL18329.1 ATP-dependent helicase [Arcobacter sp. AZ-2023]WNL20464.1 ATP-dependent helicase [Arcobacter sp. AZ-2023]WNL25743.1 ATP-dependent helicase [Arcobacter sp. AZ-2023]WPD08833.1 ATP-dependent helicase [Arcobacter sp. DSM 115954]
MIATLEQENIINYDGNLVTIAKPGSGKTFVLAEKIKRILPKLLEYEGIIAISFTNKASEELKERSLVNGIDKKNSFFGTIHKFYISEIVTSFGKQLFGLPNNDLKILNFEQDDIDISKLIFLRNLVSSFKYSNTNHTNELKEMFIQGKVYLELIEKFAIYIYDNSLSCRKYLQTKYKYIIIDEFQDCGAEQYYLFMKLKNLGLISIAVGDLNQSIYAFTGRTSDYLIKLMKNPTFKSFSLSKNHRCHPSIINYSLRLMSPNAQLLNTDSINVFYRKIPGDESDIAKWIDTILSTTMKNFNVVSLSEVAILTKNYRTAKIIDNCLTTPHRLIQQSKLESDNNVSKLFDNILKFSFNNENTIIEIIEMFISIDIINSREQKILIDNFNAIKTYLSNGGNNFNEIKDSFKRISDILLPFDDSVFSLNILEQVFQNELFIYSSKLENEIQILTLHKSKGLEFDIVFHLDLYEWILPAKRLINRISEYIAYQQDLNLHYVGITRAKKACILCTSTMRTNHQNRIINSTDSEYFVLNNVNNLSK